MHYIYLTGFETTTTIIHRGLKSLWKLFVLWQKNTIFICSPGFMDYKWVDCITVAYKYRYNYTSGVHGRFIDILSYNDRISALGHNSSSMITSKLQ